MASQSYQQIFDEVRLGVSYVAQEWPTQLMHNGYRETVYAHFVYQPLTDEQMQVTAVVVVTTNVNLRVLAQVNAELRTINIHLTRTNANPSDFTCIASHNLKALIINV